VVRDAKSATDSHFPPFSHRELYVATILTSPIRIRIGPLILEHEQSKTPIPRLVSAASGVVLELGPGLGNQLRHFDKNKITRVLGIENNANFIPDLERQVQEQNMQGIYEIAVCGVEESDVLLEKHGIGASESVDTVLSVQVLCSVPNADAVMREMYRVLKPGGKFVFYEHHRSGDLATRAVQCKQASISSIPR